MNNMHQIPNNRLVQSLLFWTVSFFVLLRIFTRTEEVRTIDYIYTGLFHLPLIVGVLANQFCAKWYLDKQRYPAFILGFLFSLFIITQVYVFTFDYLADLLFPDYFFIRVYECYEILGIGFGYLFITTLLHVAKGWFQQQKDIARVAQLEEENKRSELQALRAQVNPHFLFNSLNTIYNEARKKSDKAPQLILKLSSLLRYVVGTMNQAKVPLGKELEYLDNFIGLHKERLNNPEKVVFTTEGDFSNYEIAPLLLIIFVENCFKHGDLTEADARITISLTLVESELILRCRNTFSPNQESPAGTMGTGLQNARRRLELAYENRHTLDIYQTSNEYETILKLKISKADAMPDY